MAAPSVGGEAAYWAWWMKGRSDADKTATQVYSTVHEGRAEPHIDLTIDYLSISELWDLLIAIFF